MKVVDGDYIFKATAQCFVQFSGTSAWVFLEKDQMVAKIMHAQEHKNDP